MVFMLVTRRLQLVGPEGAGAAAPATPAPPPLLDPFGRAGGAEVLPVTDCCLLLSTMLSWLRASRSCSPRTTSTAMLQPVVVEGVVRVL